MRWVVIFTITSFISIGVAVLLTNLSLLNDKVSQFKIDSSTEQTFINTSQQLDNDNLVDHLIDLRLYTDIYRVDWNHSILSVDLKLPINSINSTLIYKDLLQISHMALEEMSNVKQVLIRVLQTQSVDARHAQFILAMDAHRDNWSSGQYVRYEENKISADQYVRAHFSFTYSQQWDDLLKINE